LSCERGAHRVVHLLISLRIGTTKAISCAWMAGKKEFSAVGVNAFKSFFQMFPVPDGESGQSCGVRRWKGTSMVRRLISERSYPWTFPGLARQ